MKGAENKFAAIEDLTDDELKALHDDLPRQGGNDVKSFGEPKDPACKRSQVMRGRAPRENVHPINFVISGSFRGTFGLLASSAKVRSRLRVRGASE